MDRLLQFTRLGQLAKNQKTPTHPSVHVANDPPVAPERPPMNTLAWTYLILGGVFEIGWPVGLKMAQTPGKVIIGVILATACMVLSGFLLFMAQKSIPMGTAYAVWTGIGAAGTFCVGIFLYGDAASVIRIMAVFLIISGVVLLKVSH
jgi:quaternary ammonium compound-resistance protein SugE